MRYEIRTGVVKKLTLTTVDSIFAVVYVNCVGCKLAIIN